VSYFSSIVKLLRFHRKNWKAVLLCVLAATVFWFFNSLNKTYSTNLNFPLAIDYDEESYVPVSGLPAAVRLNVSGLGWDLFRRSIGLKVPPLRIQLENPAEVRKIPGSSLLSLFSPQMDGLQLNLVLTDTLHLQIDHRATRSVTISVDSIGRYLREGYSLSSAVVIQPAEITVEGPKSLLAALQPKYELKLPVQNLDRNFKDVIELTWGTASVSSNPPVINVAFSVDRLMQITDTIPLTVTNIPAEVKSALLIRQVPFTYSIPVILAGTVNHDSVHAELDLQGLNRGRYTLVPSIKGLPPFSRVVKVDSVKIVF
jgi:hypothetical protein